MGTRRIQHRQSTDNPLPWKHNPAVPARGPRAFLGAFFRQLDYGSGTMEILDRLLKTRNHLRHQTCWR
jgi:hypothetical protein